MVNQFISKNLNNIVLNEKHSPQRMLFCFIFETYLQKLSHRHDNEKIYFNITANFFFSAFTNK